MKDNSLEYQKPFTFPVRGLRIMGAGWLGSGVPGFQCSMGSVFKGFPISHFQLTCSGFHSVIKDRKLEMGNRKFSVIFDFQLIKFQSFKIPA